MLLHPAASTGEEKQEDLQGRKDPAAGRVISEPVACSAQGLSWLAVAAVVGLELDPVAAQAAAWSVPMVKRVKVPVE